VKEADFLPALKTKYNKTGDDSRYQGTMLGKEADLHTITIVGGPVGSIHEWTEQLRSKTVSPRLSSPASSGISSAPLTPMNDAFEDG
jgi:transcription initiation factor TFIID subunit 3